MKHDYWFYRERLSKIIPRMSKLTAELDAYKQKEKGRKKNYSQFNLMDNEYVKMERLLDSEHINSFLEVSLRAQSCPMPLNIDTWDGLKCPYQCKYCFADYFRHSLYTSFFDNGKNIGLRHCAIDHYKKELDQLFKIRKSDKVYDNSVKNAIKNEIPIRLGIRFEDFTAAEEKHGIALELLKYLRDAKYPVMINTKSDLPGKGEYLETLRDNPAGGAIHFTLISSDEDFIRTIEPGAPSFAARLKSAKDLVDAGVRVVARIEPWMMFMNDDKAEVDNYIKQIKDAGIKHLTFDSYSYSAHSKGLASNFHQLGYDFERMFLLSSDSQWLSSFMLGKFIEYFQENGFNCSTFDQGCVPDNDDWICCSVGDFFDKYGFNWGCGVIAIKYIQSKKGKPVSWMEFENFVNTKGGFLSETLKQEVKMLWNGIGDAAWPIFWGRGITAVGHDSYGILYKFEDDDFRKKLVEAII